MQLGGDLSGDAQLGSKLSESLRGPSGGRAADERHRQQELGRLRAASAPCAGRAAASVAVNEGEAALLQLTYLSQLTALSRDVAYDHIKVRKPCKVVGVTCKH